MDFHKSDTTVHTQGKIIRKLENSLFALIPLILSLFSLTGCRNEIEENHVLKHLCKRILPRF